jgi:hypothetical protein
MKALLSIVALVSFAQPSFASCELVTDKLLYTLNFRVADNVPQNLTTAIENSIATANRVAGETVFTLNKEQVAKSSDIGQDGVSTISAAQNSGTSAFYIHNKIYEIDVTLANAADLDAKTAEYTLTTSLLSFVCH